MGAGSGTTFDEKPSGFLRLLGKNRAGMWCIGATRGPDFGAFGRMSGVFLGFLVNRAPSRRPFSWWKSSYQNRRNLVNLAACSSVRKPSGFIRVPGIIATSETCPGGTPPAVVGALFNNALCSLRVLVYLPRERPVRSVSEKSSCFLLVLVYFDDPNWRKKTLA